MRSKAFGPLMTLMTFALATFVLSGCPQEVELPDMYGFKPVSKDLKVPEAEGPKALPDRVKREASKRRVDAMRTAFAEPSELTCKVDSDCTLMPQHCCGCSEGGRRVAVSRTAFSSVIQRRSAVCKDQTCRQVVSEDESCAATKAKCVNNSCVVDLASVVKTAPKGVGVEPIADTPKKAAPKTAPTAPTKQDAPPATK